MTINLSMPQADTELKPRITVIGVGGAGGNAVNNMIRAELEGVDFFVANTDAQALGLSLCERRIQLGTGYTQGLGAGSRPDVGRAAAEESLDEVMDHLAGSHMVFVTAGMGGGTGTGAAPVIARAMRERGVLTVGVVTKPFQFEGAQRMRIAEAGVEELQAFVDTLIIIPNQNLFRVANEKTTFAEAFCMADDVLHAGVRGVTDLMVMPGLINLDFADIRSVMGEMGKAMMGTGEASGERRALDAAESAISNPLLDDVSMKGAKGVLINITGGPDITLFEVDEAANRIREEVDPEAGIIFGSTFDDKMDGAMRVSVIATGIDAEASAAPRPAPLSLVADGGRRVTSLDPTPVPPRTAMPDPVAVARRPMEGAGPVNTALAEDLSDLEPEIDSLLYPGVVMDGAADSLAEREPAMTALAGDEFVAPELSAPPATSIPPAAPETPEEPTFDAEPAPPPEASGVHAGRNEPPAQRPKERRWGPSLFERVTGAARSPKPARPERTEPQIEAPSPTSAPAAPAAPSAPAAPETRPESRDEEAAPVTVERRDPVDQGAKEEDLLDIPAFLRRQAN